jgi:hypothetical protein
MQAKLVSSGNGRIILHLATLNQDWKFGWHIKGILRELAGR